MANQTYTVTPCTQSPFYADSVGQNCLILFDDVKGEPYAALTSQATVQAGDIIDPDDIVEIHFTNKKSKFLTVGDEVNCGPHRLFVGTIERIEPANQDEWSWDDVFIIKDLHFNSTLPIKETSFTTDRLFRKDCEHKKYSLAEVNVSDEKKWKKIREAFNVAQWNGNLSPNECFNFLKKLTVPK